MEILFWFTIASVGFLIWWVILTSDGFDAPEIDIEEVLPDENGT